MLDCTLITAFHNTLKFFGKKKAILTYKLDSSVQDISASENQTSFPEECLAFPHLWWKIVALIQMLHLLYVQCTCIYILKRGRVPPIYLTSHTSFYTSFSLIPHLADVAYVTNALSRCYQLLVANTSTTSDVINKPD